MTTIRLRPKVHATTPSRSVAEATANELVEQGRQAAIVEVLVFNLVLEAGGLEPLDVTDRYAIIVAPDEGS